MPNREALIFCTASLSLSLGLAAVLYPFASLSEEALTTSQAPQNMEAFETVVDLGEDLGPLTVLELMAHYLDNPPQPADRSAPAEPVRKFGGC